MKSDLVYLGHMFDNACKAVEKLADKTQADFDGDDTLQLALVYLIQTIGESARRVSDSTRLRLPEIPFHQIIGMRNKVVQDYLAVDFDIVYNVVTQDLPPLIEVLARIIPLEQ